MGVCVRDTFKTGQSLELITVTALGVMVWYLFSFFYISKMLVLTKEVYGDVCE